MLKQLLTPAQVAEIFHLSRRTVLSLKIPRARVGEGRGKILFHEDDVREYLRLCTEYPVEKGASDAGRVQKKSKTVGLSVLPSRKHLQKLRLSYQGGSDTSGGGA